MRPNPHLSSDWLAKSSHAVDSMNDPAWKPRNLEMLAESQEELGSPMVKFAGHRPRDLGISLCDDPKVMCMLCVRKEQGLYCLLP